MYYFVHIITLLHQLFKLYFLLIIFIPFSHPLPLPLLIHFISFPIFLFIQSLHLLSFYSFLQHFKFYFYLLILPFTYFNHFLLLLLSVIL